jgi:hypothetical protein
VEDDVRGPKLLAARTASCSRVGPHRGHGQSAAANKYGYWTNEKLPGSPEEWFEGAKQHEGSWWTNWREWLTPYLGREVPARVPGKGKLRVIEAAPGTYARIQRGREVNPASKGNQTMVRFNRILFIAALAAAPGVFAQGNCIDCGVVQSMRYVQEKGQGSGLGLVAGGVVGGVLGHQIGSGRGNTVATIAGAGAGAYAGNEIEKNKKGKSYWAVAIRNGQRRDAQLHLHEQADGPRRRAREARRRRPKARALGELAPSCAQRPCRCMLPPPRHPGRRVARLGLGAATWRLTGAARVRAALAAPHAAGGGATPGEPAAERNATG